MTVIDSRNGRRPAPTAQPERLPGVGICLAIEVDGTLGFAGKPPGTEALNALIEVGRAGVRTIAITDRLPGELTGWFDGADQLELVCASGAIQIPATGTGGAARVRSIPADLAQRIVRQLVRVGEGCLLEYVDRRVVVGDAGAGRAAVTRLEPGVAPDWTGIIRITVPSSRRWASQLRQLGGDRLTVLPRRDGTVQALAAGCTPAAGLQRLIVPEPPALHGTDRPARPRRAAAAGPRPLLVVCGSSTDALTMISVAEIGVVIGDGLSSIDRLRHVRRVPAIDHRVAGGIRTAVRKAMRHLHERPELAG